MQWGEEALRGTGRTTKIIGLYKQTSGYNDTKVGSETMAKREMFGTNWKKTRK